MNRLKKNTILDILDQVAAAEYERNTKFIKWSEEPYYNRPEPNDFLLNEYRWYRYIRLKYVSLWIRTGLFPSELSDGQIKSIGKYIRGVEDLEHYKEIYVLPLEKYSQESIYDIFPIFENKMLEEWEKKIKQTQVRSRKGVN